MPPRTTNSYGPDPLAQTNSYGYVQGGPGPGIQHAWHFTPKLPGPDWVGIFTEQLWGEGSGYVICRLGQASPQVVHGGGFEDQPRPLRRGVPRWRGTATPVLPLTVILDGTHANRSVENECHALLQMAGGMVPHDPEPPKLRLVGESFTKEIKGQHQRWVLAEPPAFATDPDGVIRRTRDMDRVFQIVDLTFMLASGDADLDAAVGQAQAAPKYRYIRAKSHDTYEKIAKRELGEKRLAHRLAKLNDATSVDHSLKEGKRVKLPTGALLAEWKRDLKRR